MKIKNIIIASCIAFVAFTSCTNLDEHVYDKYAADEFYGTPEGSDVALAAV